MRLNKKSICTGHSGTSDPITYETESNQKQTKPTTARTSKLSGIKMEKWENIICIN